MSHPSRIAVIPATTKNLKDIDRNFSISVFNSPTWLVQETGWSWRMTVSFQKLKGVVTASRPQFSVQDMASSSEQFNAHYCIWQEIMRLAEELCVFQLLACEHYQKPFALRWRSQQFTSTLLPQWDIGSLDQCHQLLCRNSDYLSCLQQITLLC